MCEKIKKAVIREDLLSITGDYKKAIILNQFIYWSERVSDADKFIEKENEIAQANGEESRELFYGWIYKSAEELSGEVMLGLSASQIRKHINALVDMGYLYKRNNPKYKWDRTLQYRVNLVKIARDLKKKGYSLSDYKIFLPDDDLLNTHERAIIDAKNEDQTVDNDEAIPEITSETTNKDYIPETTAINAFESLDSKGNIHAFLPDRKEVGEEKIPYIDLDNCTLDELSKHIQLRVKKFMLKHDEYDDERAGDLSKIIDYFYRKYRAVYGENYTILSDKAFEGIVIKYLYPSLLLNDNEIYGFEEYKKMIDQYFKTDYGQRSGNSTAIDRTLPHFMSDTIRENLAMNTLELSDMGSAWSL